MGESAADRGREGSLSRFRLFQADVSVVREMISKNRFDRARSVAEAEGRVRVRVGVGVGVQAGSASVAPLRIEKKDVICILGRGCGSRLED